MTALAAGFCFCLCWTETTDPQEQSQECCTEFHATLVRYGDPFLEKGGLPFNAPFDLLHFFLLGGFEFSAFEFLRLFVVAVIVAVLRSLVLRLRDREAAQADERGQQKRTKSHSRNYTTPGARTTNT